MDYWRVFIKWYSSVDSADSASSLQAGSPLADSASSPQASSGHLFALRQAQDIQKAFCFTKGFLNGGGGSRIGGRCLKTQ